MGMEQETLIYIEENDKKEARILTQSFANAETKSRAYINALGANLGMKYLALENIIICTVFTKFLRRWIFQILCSLTFTLM